MKLFHCDNCGSAVFFENVKCLHCASTLAFLPDRLSLNAIEQVPEAEGLWRRIRKNRPSARHYRLCQNSTQQEACNFAIPAADPNPLCVCCRLTQMLPDLSTPGNHARWFRIEVAKRRFFEVLVNGSGQEVFPGRLDDIGQLVEGLRLEHQSGPGLILHVARQGCGFDPRSEQHADGERQQRQSGIHE